MDNFLDNFTLFLTEYGETLIGFILAFLMALFRTAQKNGKADLAEAFMCSGLTLGASSILGWLQLPQSFAVGLGAFIGYMGTNYVREEIVKRFSKDNQK
ncbi:phage holin family protein [Acinetobacter sp. A47]|uniref:phage holin family protein n=1 Tax=Acinetobacter sp. A47 TaxID=1561217 RepID=UPI00056DCA96|nr:phage holin family protein [Acinetobacter sp. A47]